MCVRHAQAQKRLKTCQSNQITAVIIALSVYLQMKESLYKSHTTDVFIAIR